MTANSIDWSAWPVVTVHAHDLAPPAARRLVFDALHAALARGGAFALIAAVAPTPPARPKPSEALATVRELRALRPQLVQWCCGVAFAGAAQARPRNADRMWGCPTHTAATITEAREWARNQLSHDLQGDH